MEKEGKKIINDFIRNRPQRLCHMCGRCCRVATTPYPHEELLKEAQEGTPGAADFLRLFEPYESIEEAKKVDSAIVDNIIHNLKLGDNYDENKLTFYHCRYIQDNGLCGIYKERPELCDRFPSNPWAVAPPGCGFEGWLFEQQEDRKKRIRKLKENVLDLEVMLNELQDPEKRQRVIEALENTKKTINLFAKYGSFNW